MRSLKAPARDETAAGTSAVKHGAELFIRIGCASCHVETIVTRKSPASPGGPGLHPDALEGRTIHPYSDFLLHNVGTGDGIAIALVEHFGRERVEKRFREERSATSEAKGPSGRTEDECSENYQTAVAEEKDVPTCCSIRMCAPEDQDRAPLGIAATLAADARRQLGPTWRRHSPSQRRIRASNRAVSEAEALGQESSAGLSAIAVTALERVDFTSEGDARHTGGASLTDSARVTGDTGGIPSRSMPVP